MTDLRDLCARMADELDHYRQLLMDDRSEVHALATEARARLAEPAPERLTVQEIDNLPQNVCKYIYEDPNEGIQLNGYFSRADLQQLAISIPTNRSNSNA